MIHQNRRTLIMFYMLTQTDQYIRSSDFAQQLKVTERTVKSDIRELKDYVATFGAKLVSSKGNGYRLEIVDPERYQFAKEQLTYYYVSSGNDDLTYHGRTNAILRRIVAEEKYMSVEDIAQQFYLNVSSIRNEMRLTNFFIREFNLSLKKKNEEGPLVKGDEFNRRMLMMFLLETPYHGSINLFEASEYIEWFEVDEEKKLQVYDVFHEELRKSHCHIRDGHAQRIVRYICLLANRNKSGYTLSFTEESRRKIKEYWHYTVILNTFKRLKWLELLNPEQEIAGAAMILAGWSEYTSDQIQQLPQEVLEQTNRLSDEFCQSIVEDYGFSLEPEKNKTILVQALLPIVIQKEFEMSAFLMHSLHIDDSKVKNCGFALRIANNIKRVFERRFKVKVSIYNCMNLGKAIYEIMLKKNYEYRKINALICSSNGYSIAEVLRQIVIKFFGPYFSRLDIHEVYELENVEQLDYDCVIGEFPDFGYNHSLPIYRLSFLPTVKQMNDLYEKEVLRHVEIEPILEKMSFPSVQFIDDFKVSSLSSFYKLCAEKYAANEQKKNQIIEQMHDMRFLCTYRGKCIFFINSQLTNSSFFDVYTLKKSQPLMSVSIDTLIMVSVKCDSLQQARLINELMSSIYGDEDCLMKLRKNNCKSGIADVIRHELHLLPFILSK